MEKESIAAACTLYASFAKRQKEIVILEGLEHTRPSVVQVFMCGHNNIERNLNKHSYALLRVNLR